MSVLYRGDWIVMYQQHFGLKKRPFRATPTNADVFVGPQAATTMSGIKTALAISDAIVTISGPVGCGKTTLVQHALDSIGGNRKIISVARLRLNTMDVLDLLLAELGQKDPPSGAIQKFVAFRRKLKELQDNDAGVIVVVEDGVRLGADTLAELEALTAADAGHSEGANVVLMGDERLDEVLRDPQLARIRQRVRQRQIIAPLNPAELRGYLQHCFRLAGGDFEKLFEADAAILLHQLSGGIPRITNNLAESALTAAAGQDLELVASSLLTRIAENEFGLSAESPKSAPAPAPVAEATRQEARQAEPAPELIQDTLPDLEILSPELAAAAVEKDLNPAREIPEWERDPTLAQLRPDLDALEQAMAVAKSGDTLPPTAKFVTRKTAPTTKPEKIPEITLDHAIKQRIEDNLIDEPGEISPAGSKNVPADPAEENAPVENHARENDAKDKAEIEKIAAELSKAKSIEDVDGKAAETLFGEEFSLIAAQVVAKVEAAKSANEDLTPGNGDNKPTPAAPVAPGAVHLPQAATAGDGTELSPTQRRLKTVREMNSEKPKPVPQRKPNAANTNTATPAAKPAPPKVPDSIEDQINTSMTATLKVLHAQAPTDEDDADDEADSKGGLLGRFKRS